ncbi:MAG: NAD(P)H-hydrate epimerase [Candidatus Omnitrophica bacterium]|nr:NAD(P)H-hydrate epimerase [Candidatus Omnitrophota bacterium]
MDTVLIVKRRRTLSSEGVARVDRAAREIFGIPEIVLMENAGRAVAEAACEMLGKKKRACILCGRGKNGGDGFVAARHLLNAAKNVRIYLFGAVDKVTGISRDNLNVLLAMGAEVIEHEGEIDLFSPRLDMSKTDLIIDALLGSGTTGEVREPYRSLIALVNVCGKPVLSIDIPSGIHPDTGEVLGIAVKAVLTVTFVLPKTGLLIKKGPSHAGRIIIDPIGIPQSVFTHLK